MELKRNHGYMDISNIDSGNHGIVAISSKALIKKLSEKSKKEGFYKTRRGDYDVQLCYGAKNYYIGTYQRKVRLP